MFLCHICAKTQPALVKNVHHIRPQAAGGSDEPQNLVAICNRCHDALHSAEIALRNPKRSGCIEDQLQLLFESRDAVARCLQLARQAHHWFQQKREGTLVPTGLATDRIQISLTSAQKLMLKAAAKDSNCSMNDLATNIVLSYLNSKFGAKTGDVRQIPKLR